LTGLQQSVDRGVEVPMFLAQPLDMAQDRLALFVAQFVLLRHGPAPCNTPPRSTRAPSTRLCGRRRLRARTFRNENF
jgi:hypothetical protein